MYYYTCTEMMHLHVHRVERNDVYVVITPVLVSQEHVILLYVVVVLRLHPLYTTYPVIKITPPVYLLLSIFQLLIIM